MIYHSLKLTLIVLVMGLLNSEVYSQTDNVGIGTTTPNNSAVLDLTSTTKGFLAPRMTQAQRTAIATPANGLVVYQTDNSAGFYYYNGTTWIYGLNGSGASSFAWGLTGNAGTNPTNNFVGTTDNQPLYFKSNNVAWYIINTNGSLQRDNSGNARGVQAVDLQSNRSSVTQVSSGDYSFLANGVNNTASGTNSFVGGGNNNFASGANSAIIGGQYLKLGTSSFGFNASGSSLIDLSALSNIGYFGNANLMIGNDDNTARELRFLQPTTTPGTAYYSSFKSQAQTANISYVLPATQGTANTLLKNDGSGNLSWDASNQSRARAYLGAAQTIPNATWTQVGFNNENFDSKNEFSITNYEFTCQETGYYQVNSRVEFDWTNANINNQSAYCQIAIYVNASVYSYGNKLGLRAYNDQGVIRYNDSPVVSDIVYATAGQTIRIYVFHSYGSGKDLSPNSSVTYVSIHRLS